MKDTVLVIGSHPNAREGVDWGRDDCDYWTFNEAYSKRFSPDAKESDKWCKRSDAIFQIHDPVIWNNPVNRNDSGHAAWLKSGETPTIYMQEAYLEVPEAVKYPLGEVIERFGDTCRKFFTSTVAYGLALACYMGYKNIEVYGVEMEFGSEYFEQRDAVTYWFGVATGLGINLKPFCKFLEHRPMYGYERLSLQYDDFCKRIEELTPLCDQAKTNYDTLRSALHEALKQYVMTGNDPGNVVVRRVQEMAYLASLFGQYDGARQVNEQTKDKADKQTEASGGFFFGKTEFETNATSHMQAKENAVMETVALSGKLEEKYKSIASIKSLKKREKIANEFIDVIESFIVKSQNIGFFTGASEECKRYANLLHSYSRAMGGDAPRLV